MARGLILDQQAMIVARPFPKFFNLGEPSCPTLPNTPYEVFEKLDGSLGIWFYHQGAWRVSTKGSFDNDYTRWATLQMDRLACMPQNWTILTEVVLPPSLDGMARVVKHCPGVYLLGAIHRDTGEDIPLSRVKVYWPAAQFATTYPGAEIERLLAQANTDEGSEGWVVRFENGLRVKIKTAWYLRLFRSVSNLNERSIRELLLEGGTLADFPEEFRVEAEAIRDALLDRVAERHQTIEHCFARYNHPDRKTFALSICDVPDKAFLFDLYDRKDITARLLKTT